MINATNGILGPCPLLEGKKVTDPKVLMPPDFHSRPWLRVTVIVLTILVTLVVAFGLNGSLPSFPAKFLAFVHQIDWIHVGLVAGALVVLTAGAAILIHRVRHNIGKVTGNDHWISCVTVDQNTKAARPGHLDVSTLDENRSGYAFIYIVKGEYPHYSLMFALIGTAPLHMIGTIVYNIIHLLAVPFHVMWNSEKYPPGTIWNETKLSLQNIVEAPFYAVARMFAGIYGLFDVLNGRKLMTYLEREQIGGITCPKSFWSVRGFQELSEWKGFGHPGNEGNLAFIVAGCLQPLARVQFKKGKAILVESASRVEKPTKGSTFNLILSDKYANTHDCAD